MINKTIAHYKITSKLGQGGMGEVYRATDTKLDRDVAIKILPESFAGDKNRVARFKREAKILATLSHPNIAAIYGIEKTPDTHALVMELVEGETLGERLKREPMTVEEALDCCKQIAEALEAAHEKGIIHRDLKPENVKINQDGHVKVLDFGLAKEVVDPASIAAQAESPTITHMTTIPGELLGTAPYMSPEQARAKPVDKRSDIWSFGCVLFECLTGKRMFGGEDVAETLASIIKGEPEWALLPENTPPTIHLLLRKCLNKDRKRRLQHIGDARVDLEQALGDPSSSIMRLSDLGIQETARPRGLSPQVAVVALVLVALLGVALGWLLKPTPFPAPAPATHSELILPGSIVTFLTLSPDDRYLSFDIPTRDDPINLRPLYQSGEVTGIAGTEDNWNTFFSPDGKSIAYPSASTNQILRVALDGSKPVPVAHMDLTGYNLPGGSWSEQGEIVCPSGWADPLVKVASVGGKFEPLTQLRAGEAAHRWPQCLPGGTHVLFSVLSEDAPSNRQGGKVAIADLATGSHQILPLEDDCVYPRYAESGHLLYVNDGILFAVPFDMDSMTLTGPKKDMVQGIATFRGLALYDISKHGTLVYRRGAIAQEKSNTLMWLLPDGTEEAVATLEGDVQDFTLSPDGKRLALSIREADHDDNEEIWIFDLERQLPIRFTHHDANDQLPFWSADGQWIYFKSDRGGRIGLWKKTVDSPGGTAEFVFEHDGLEFWPASLSDEGSHLTYNTLNPTWDIWTVPLDQPNPKRRLLKGSSATEAWNAVSPDGNWLAYNSDITGDMELYVASFHDPNSQMRRITADGGGVVTWSRNGDRLFYLRSNLPGEPIWRVDVSVEKGVISTGVPQPTVRLKSPIVGWRVHAIGERMLVMVADEFEMMKHPGIDNDHNVVHVVSNFFTELNEKAPPSE